MVVFGAIDMPLNETATIPFNEALGPGLRADAQCLVIAHLCHFCDHGLARVGAGTDDDAADYGLRTIVSIPSDAGGSHESTPE